MAPPTKNLLFALMVLRAVRSYANPYPQVTTAPVIPATSTTDASNAWQDCTREAAAPCAGIIYDPETWCQPQATNVLYPTISGATGAAACAFTASPTTTVDLGIFSTYLIATVPSCASKAGITVQPETSTSSTTDWVHLATPTKPSKCYPTHDSPWKDLQVEVNNAAIQSACAGTDAGWQSRGGENSADPPENNQVQQGIILAPNAPDECKSFYGRGHNSDVTTLCAAPFQKILADCPYNGGENTNICGTFWMETCPLEEVCTRGDPGGPWATMTATAT